MMENRKSESSDTNGLSLESYTKHLKTGAIFQVFQDPKNESKVFLRAKNSQSFFTKQHLQQGIVNKVWGIPNKHEVRNHIKEEEKYLDELNNKLIRRVLFTQLLMELDDELKEDYSDDKYIRGLLERSNKAFERLVGDTYKRMYDIDKTFLINMLKNVEQTVQKVSKLKVEHFVPVNIMLDNFIADPDKYTPKMAEMVMIDGDISNKNVVFEEVAAEQEDELHG